jgi:microcystin-dependent protein
MADQYVGEIRLFGFNFAPAQWALCNGQLLSISTNSALFSLLGTFYGGDGRTNFALPNLQSRVPIHQGQGTGLSPYVIGEMSGTETVTLTQQQMPQHGHSALSSGSQADGSRPAGAVLARTTADIYTAAPDGTAMNPGMIGTAGGSQPHPNLQPFLVINFCIALTGIFPSRN